MEALSETDDDVYMQIISALGRIGDARAVEALIFGLSYMPDEDVRTALVDALRHIGDPSVVALIEALRDEDVGVRGRATLALGDIGDARAVEALKEALKDEYKYVRETATQALEKIEAKQKSTNMEAEKDPSDE